MSNTVIEGDLIETPETRAIKLINPMILLEIAITKGADVPRLNALMEFFYKWEDRNAKKAFNDAMSELQAKIPVIAKNGKAGFKSNDGRYFISYSYAKLEDIAFVINPLLADSGLSFRWDQDQNDDGITVTCVVSHKDGSSISVPMTAPRDATGKKNYIQSFGSTISYLRRYTILSAFGLTVSDEDNDAGADAGAGTGSGAAAGAPFAGTDAGDDRLLGYDAKTTSFLLRCIEGVESGIKTKEEILVFIADRMEVTQHLKEIINLVKVK